jgi:hypothetical protein
MHGSREWRGISSIYMCIGRTSFSGSDQQTHDPNQIFRHHYRRNRNHPRPVHDRHSRLNRSQDSRGPHRRCSLFHCLRCSCDHRWRCCHDRPGARSMISFLFAVIFKVALPLLFIVAIVDLLTMSKARRVRMHRRSGQTWAAIAQRFNVSPSTVRRWSMA